ncbi:hypothetical protein ADL27_09050 [Streptomyces sp. NRRL F-6602]|nr:hypothetical protein ADL27_09050 [Streptomyces sp. NRRL F-6602]
MNSRLARVLAGLALTTAAATGAITLHTATVSADTAWGAPATEDDTAWGTPPGEDDPEPPADGDEGPSPVPFDTAWG